MAKCPYCKEEFDGEGIVREPVSDFNHKLDVVIFSCPECDMFLGIGPEPKSPE